MKICQNCGHENNDTSNFCEACGAKLGASPKFCPQCGEKLEGAPNFCPKCGFNLAEGKSNPETETEYEESYANEEMYDYENEEEETSVSFYDQNDDETSDSDYEEYVDEDEYADDETTEEKIKKIVDKYIGDINKSGTGYSSAAINNPKYAQVFQNVRTNIAKEKKQSELYGYIDVTLLGKGKAGLLLTNDTLYLKEAGGSIALPYYAIFQMYIKGNSLYFSNSKGYGKGLLNLDEVYISGISYNLPALKDCLEEIKNVL